MLNKKTISQKFQINLIKIMNMIISCHSITVNDANYEISGTVSDQSKRIFIEVDGQSIQTKKGKFTIKRYSPVDEQIKIVAIDNWGNRSKPQVINIIIDKNNFQADDEPLNPSKIEQNQ